MGAAPFLTSNSPSIFTSLYPFIVVFPFSTMTAPLSFSDVTLLPMKTYVALILFVFVNV